MKKYQFRLRSITTTLFYRSYYAIIFKSEVQSIIGFDGKYLGNGLWVWGNIFDPKEEIKVKVLNNQIVRISKKGFR